jgi:hypothetical protein
VSRLREVATRSPAALLLAQSAVLTAVLTWPTLPRLATDAVGAAGTDTPKHLWTLWWMRKELLEGVPGLQTRWVNFPDGMELFPISPLDGLLSLALPASPVLAANLLALAHVGLLGLCAGWLGWEVVRTRVGAHVVSALAQGAAFTGFALEVGVGELRLAWWIPLGLACLVRAHRTRAPRWFAALGLALAGAVLSCFYHGLFLATATAVWALVTLERRRDLLLGYALAAGLSLVLVLPIIHTFSASYAAEGAQLLFPGASASVDELATPAQLAGPRTAGYGAGRYLGFLALGLAAAGVVAAPRRAAPWVLVALVSIVLALGPVLRWGGAPVVVGGNGFVLPMAWLNDVLGRVAEPINFPARFLAPAMVALAVLGGLATRWRAAALLAPLAVLDILANDGAAWPRATMQLPPTHALAGAAGAGAVADLSMVASHAEPAVRTRSIAAQLTLARPFASVPVERLSAWGSSGDTWLRALPLVQVVTTVELGATPTGASDFREDLWLLRDRGYERLLLSHTRDTPDARAEALLTRLCGAPTRTPQVTMWAVPEIAATEAEAAAWRQAQAARLGRR